VPAAFARGRRSRAGGAGVTYSNVSGGKDSEALVIHDLKLHVLAQGPEFSLSHRGPREPGRDNGRPPHASRGSDAK
jgi:hypothetical protein